MHKFKYNQIHDEIHWISCVIWNYFLKFGHIYGFVANTTEVA